METVTISKEEYELLVKDSIMLGILECAGVANWSGYGYAIEILEELDDE